MTGWAPSRRSLLCLLLVGLPTGVWAQDATAPYATGADTTLTLEEALRLARVNNPALRRAVNETERATVSERRGWAGYLPQIDVNASLNESEATRLTAIDDFGEPVALEDAATFSSTSASGQIGASMVLFDGFRRFNQLEAARAGSHAAGAFVEAEQIRIEAEVRRRFYNAIGADRFIAVEERLLAAAEDRLEAGRAMVDAGRATPQDALRLEVDVARQQISLEAARGNLTNRKVLLAEVLGLEEYPAFDVEGDFPPLFDPSVLDEERLIAVALRSNPQIERATASLAQAENQRDAARAIRWPTVRLNAGLNRNISLPDRDQLTDFPWNRGFGLSLSASMPIFSGFQASEQIANASVAHANARETLREARLAVERQVRIALTNAVNAFSAVRLAERAAELSRQGLDGAQEGFRRGVVDFTALQQFIERAAQTERAAVRARVTWAEVIVSLDAAVGERIRPEDSGGAGGGER